MTISLREHGLSAFLVGVAQGIIGVGGLLGAVAAPRISRRLSLRTLAVVTCWLLLVCLAAAAFLASHVVVAVPITLGLLLAPAANAALFGRLGATTPDHLQGRVLSVVFLAASTAASVAPAACGSLIEHVSGPTAMTLCAAAVLVSCVTATLSRGLRQES